MGEKIKLLGVLLCYNDSDILSDSIEALLNANHDLLIWNHGSTDSTSDVIKKYKRHLLEDKFLPRSFDFYRLYQHVSKYIIRNYIKEYDWISWPDQDEILEGPNRSKSYDLHLHDVYYAGYDSIQFNNINYWFTAADDEDILSPVERIRHYSIFADCSPRIRSWRASKTNIRMFNHNPIDGIKFPCNFNLRHYPARSHEQILRRITFDRKSLQRAGANYHYNAMGNYLDELNIPGEKLFFDDGFSDLNLTIKYPWRTIYGSSADYKSGPVATIFGKVLRRIKSI